ncbi:MAG: effector-associated domain EAD1-containing protein [Chloroflexota bacterium]
MRLDFIQKALLDGFNYESLKRLLRLNLDRDIDEIASSGTLEETVFDVITTAKREGWLIELITQAKEENPGNYFINMLGGEESMQSYGNTSQDEVSEIRIVLFGSKRAGTPGFIELTNEKLSDIDDRIKRIEIVINDRSTIGSSLFESWMFKAVALVLGLSAVGSLALGIWQVLNGA